MLVQDGESAAILFHLFLKIFYAQGCYKINRYGHIGAHDWHW